jgi:glutathione S-transferase
MITLYDLSFDKDLRPSPYCWRAKLALKHKGLAWRDEPAASREAEDRLRPVADLSGDP